ncbi:MULTISPECIES: hypothetical protein [unclassified Kitasatospora]|uniref:hypothetical protein n=1 Tax=unclassified Kitasatospora TaxID=2633591 RepID=UPI00070CA556|nr:MULTISPECIES: hypothetical protein [unclassified Kitasatospora]KQV17375.1 hypothetical protein ASC99_26040 [Kitasatospora sp. Root107]KRB65534.1 hypothetical protein ASE03_32045 [Kitasatospora sp. Root187]
MLEYELIQARSQELQRLARHDALVREALDAVQREGRPSLRSGLRRALQNRRVRALSPRPQLNQC